MITVPMLLCGMIGCAAGWAVTFFVFKWSESHRYKTIEAESNRARRETATERTRVLVRAREDALAAKTLADQEAAQLRRSLIGREEKLDRREDLLRRQEEAFLKRQTDLETIQAEVGQKNEQLAAQNAQMDQAVRQQQQVLEKLSQMSRQQATDQLLQTVSGELEQERGALLLRHHEQVTDRANQQAREILLTAIQRCAAAGTAQHTTSSVDVPTDDIKGRIIGRDGRNIRAFEKATGIDVIIDDTPGVVICSGFDPVRREIARQSLSYLIADGRIHPARIEEVVAEKTDAVKEFIRQKGQEAADEVGVTGLHENVIAMLGRLHFRTSYSQNVLRHSIEVAFLSGMVAEMLNMDGPLARRCGLLHDIGKAADHELEGGHPKIGADLLRRCGEGPEVVHAALGHHDEIVIEHPYTMLTAIGDACSASRPGARRESLERYIKRMEELEQIAAEFGGVEQAYAISAGREVRVIVNNGQTSDEQAAIICRDIAKAFEQRLTYPGEIKVTVLRESQFVEVAN